MFPKVAFDGEPLDGVSCYFKLSAGGQEPNMKGAWKGAIGPQPQAKVLGEISGSWLSHPRLQNRKN